MSESTTQPATPDPIGATVAALDVALDYVATLRDDALDDFGAEAYVELRGSETRLQAAYRALGALTAAEREYVAFALGGGTAQELLERG